MKICYLADSETVHTQRWATHFAARGHDVSLITFSRSRWSAEEVELYPIANPTPSARLNYLLGIDKVKKTIKEIAPDILHSHYLTSYGLLGVLSGYHPLLVSVWGTDILVSPQKNHLYRSITKHVLSKADGIIATGNSLGDAASRYAPVDKKIYLVSLGVDLDLFKPTRKIGDKDRITIGAMKELKRGCGMEYLIRAMPIVRSEFPQVDLAIAGDGERYGEIKGEVDRLDLKNGVSFLGRLPHHEVPGFLAGLDLFVMPAMSEGFGVGILEASAMELPVVVSRVGGTHEVVLDGVTGYFVTPGDSRALAQRITDLLKDPSLRSRMGQEGREFVHSRYHWQNSTEKMEELYLSLL